MSDTTARILTGLAVLAVAVIAAVVSFSHIDTLALAHGYAPGTARLLPFSVDGLIVASSMVLLTEARAQQEAPALARAGLVLGIVATVLANVAAGARYGLTGAVVNAWPALAFIVATEILVGQMRRARAIPAPESTRGTVADTVARGVHEDVLTDVPAAVPVIGPVAVPVDDVPRVPVTVPRTVAAGRARGRAPVSKSKSVDRIFAAEIERGELPSLRQIKARARCGTDRARVVRDQLAQVLQEAPEAA